MTNKIRILLAEDDELQQEIVGILLDTIRYFLHAVGNGLEAVEAIKKEPYDLIILDLQMPVMNGIEFLRWLRKEHPSDIPVLVLTSLSSHADKEKALEAGADLVLVKPFSVRSFVGEIEMLLAERS